MIRLLILGVVGACSFFFGSILHEENDVERERMIQNAVLSILDQAHFNPVDLNDEFSDEAFDEFLQYIDGRKRFFTKEDLVKLEVYRFELDNQAKIGSLAFFDLANELLEKRIGEAEVLYQDILSKPFNFDVNESYEFDPDKKDYVSNSVELRDRWRKALKYDVMIKVESRLKRQEEDPDVEKKTFAQIEESARKDVRETYDKWYKTFKKVKRSDRFEAYLNTFAHLFDPHSEYFNPKEKQDFDISMGGKLEGIGARLRTEGDLTQVVHVVPGGPVWKGKQIEVNDLILKVKQKGEEAVDVFGMRIDDVVSMIRGKKGTFVTLTIKKKDGTIMDVEIERDVVNIEESFAKSAILNAPGVIENIGYIHLPKFYSSFDGPDGNSCAVDVAEEIEKLKENQVNGIILDLRNNGGGSLRDVVNMSGLFIKDGPIVQVKPRERKPYIYRDEDDEVRYTGPLVVMINSFSASASEILAAAMQDYQRAVIVGSQSFGKGTVQRFINLDRAVRGNSEFKPLGEIKISMQKFYRVNGGSTQLKGVTPDINLPDRYSNIEIGEREYPHAMGWSEIAGLEYDQDVLKVMNTDYLENKSSERIKQSETFTKVKEQARLYEKNRDQTNYSLNLVNYRELLRKRDEESKMFEDFMSKELESLQVSNLPQDKTAISLDETTVASNQEWLSDIRKDIYIQESLNIIGDLIKSPSYTKVEH